MEMVKLTFDFDSLSAARDFLIVCVGAPHQEPVPVPASVAETPKKPRAKKAEAPAPAPVTEAGKTLTTEDVQAALEKLFEAKGMGICLEVLSRYGAKFGRELKPEQYADFIAHAGKVAAGGAV
jgi:hypothetical protein